MNASIKSLTEEMVFQRSRTDNLALIKKLNMCGVGLDDVQLVNKCPQAEVLSFSVNNLRSLKSFQGCQNLKELYLRSNKIDTFQQLKFLSGLKKLRILTLSENPLERSFEPQSYRHTVLKFVP